jgi:hypothetical protein
MAVIHHSSMPGILDTKVFYDETFGPGHPQTLAPFILSLSTIWMYYHYRGLMNIIFFML